MSQNSEPALGWFNASPPTAPPDEASSALFKSVASDQPIPNRRLSFSSPERQRPPPTPRDTSAIQSRILDPLYDSMCLSARDMLSRRYASLAQRMSPSNSAALKQARITEWNRFRDQLDAVYERFEFVARQGYSTLPPLPPPAPSSPPVDHSVETDNDALDLSPSHEPEIDLETEEQSLKRSIFELYAKNDLLSKQLHELDQSIAHHARNKPHREWVRKRIDSLVTFLSPTPPEPLPESSFFPSEVVDGSTFGAGSGYGEMASRPYRGTSVGSGGMDEDGDVSFFGLDFFEKEFDNMF